MVESKTLVSPVKPTKPSIRHKTTRLWGGVNHIGQWSKAHPNPELVIFELCTVLREEPLASQSETYSMFNKSDATSASNT